jgi:hypothetical protein
VSPWKVILATLVIFIAGLMTGAVGVHRLLKTNRAIRPAPEPMQPWMLRDSFRAELDRRLDLSPDQNERIERIMREGQERIREIWSLVGPEVQAELKAVREEIRAELRPEQRRQFEEVIRSRKPRPVEMERPPGDRPPWRRDREPPPPREGPPPPDSGQ